MDDDTAPDEQVHSSDNEDIKNAHILKSIPSSDMPIPTNNWASALVSTYTPLSENSLLAQTGPAFELVKFVQPNVIHLRYQMEECHKLLTDSVDESIISKGGRHVLSISKMKVAYYLDVGLEQIVPDQIWIEEECKYDIAAMYGISHWWFQRQRFYIDTHISEGDRRAVWTHMQILSVVRIEVFSMYGYDYMKKIVLCRADLNERIIVERDFKYMYPSDFEDLYLLNLQGHLNHLRPKDKKILTTAVNLWTRHLDATGFEYKHDFIVFDSPRTVTFRDKYGVHMIMQFNEIHKFSDGTLHQIDEALDYRVKEFKVNMMNLGLNTRTSKRYESIHSEDGNPARANILQNLVNELMDAFRKPFEFWSTAMAKTINEEAQLHAKVDGNKIIITESSVRRDLRLADEEDIDCLLNFTIFEQLALMGVRPLFPTIVVQNQSKMGEGSAMPTDPYHTPTILQQLSQPQKKQTPRKPKRKDTQVPQLSDPTDIVADKVPQLSDPTDIVADKVVHKELGVSLATPNESSSQGNNSGGGPRCQETIGILLLKLVLELEKIKTSQHNEIASLKRRVKKFKKRNKSRTHKLKRLYKLGLTARVESSDDEESLDDAEMFDVNALDGEEVFVAKQDENVVEETVTTGEITLA
nr:hypothetical protein [Tanacetum cinerariifolium]